MGYFNLDNANDFFYYFPNGDTNGKTEFYPIKGREVKC